MTVFRKCLLTLSLSALGFSAVLVVSVLVFMNSLYYETNAGSLRVTAQTLFSLIGKERITDYFAANMAPPAGGLSGGARPSRAFPFAENGAFRLTLIDRAGDVLWDSHVAGDLVNHLDREEVRAALEGREGSARRDSLSTGMRQIYFALPVFAANGGAANGGAADGGAADGSAADGGVAGVFRLSLAVPVFWRRISAAALPFLLLAALLALAAFAAIFSFSRSLSAALGRLVDMAAGMHTPAADRTVPGPGQAAGDALEFLTLEKALRGMAAELTLRLEQARSESSRLEAILNGMSEAVFAMDGGLSLRLLNPSARKLFKLGDGDLRGCSLLEATRSTELEQAAGTALAEGRSLEMELRLHTGQGPSGSERRFQVFAAPLADGEAAVVLVMADITRLVRLEQVRKDFVANVSHELRTPIQLMKGFSETLLDSLPADAEQIRRCIGIIHQNAETMENLTNDLLSLASLENGSHDARDMEDQPLAPLFAEAVSSVEPGARQKQIEILVDCPADLSAKLHGSFITRALINLLDNGIKYSAGQSRVRAAAYRAGNELVLEVRDEGIGIPAQHLERIFERFYRLDRSRGREAGGVSGTGLGLSIVRHIALLHKGTVEVESRPGAGSVFRIRIPSRPRGPA
jgi:two-component system phosphate regulon sensor histidine kinase PhoR